MNYKFRITVLLILVTTMGAGCTVSEVISAERTELNVASLDISESLLLDVGIVNFEPGVPNRNDPVKTGVYPEVRMAEARYLPYHIKTTLQGTGFWGAVRVIPNEYAFSDILLTGKIKKSDGEFVEISVKARDSMGNEWYERSYSMQTGVTSYAEYRDRTQDPYQKVFNDIANDLRAFASTLDAQQITRIRQVSELKFFADMAPDIYGEHFVIDDEGMVSIVRLPADNDPMANRLRQIRERDRLVVDTLNEHYANFYYGIAMSYEGWRKNARQNNIAYRQTRRSATMRALLGVVVVAGSVNMNTGGSYSRAKQATQYVGINRGMRTIYDALRQRASANLYREEIRELSESFVAEAAPLVIEVDGKTRRLTGTAESQYESWRRLLKDIYSAETGFDQEISLGVPARTAQPSG
jgi:hypothetical protein